MEPRNPDARYSSLRDYLLVVRRYWVTILLIALVGLAAGLADALRQTARYQATAQVSFQDPTQQLSIVGLGTTNVESPLQLAATYATSAGSPAVLSQVQRSLHTTLSTGVIASALSTVVDQNSGLLSLTAQAKNGVFAAQLANAVADTLVARANNQARSRFVTLAANVRARIAALTAHASPKGAAVSANQLSFLSDELARLETIGSLAQSAQIASPAQAPGTRIGASRARGAAIGLLLGLLLGLGAAFVRDSLDRRLRSLADIEQAYRLPVVGNVRREAMGRLPQLGVSAGEDVAPDIEAFRILRRNVEFLDPERRPRLILITSALPEEGKTTVAGSFALALAAAGRRVLLVDCDLRRPTLAERLGVPATPGLSEYLRGNAAPSAILRTVTFRDAPAAGTGEGDEHRLVCIPAGTPATTAAELLGSSRFADFVEQVSGSYDVVLLDSSPLLPVADTLEILPHVDTVLLCAREDQTTRDQANAARAALRRFPPRPTGLVVTGIKPHTGYGAYSYAYGYND
jgi:capsular exopolysaccharide synthesis family protein